MRSSAGTDRKRPRRSKAWLAAALVVPALIAVVLPGSAGALEGGAEAPPLASAVAMPDFRPLPPTRMADTRPGKPTADGLFAGGGVVTPAAPLVLTLGGRGGVPASGVAAVALNVTVTGPAGGGYLTAYPDGQARPNASNVNFSAGQTVANSVVAKLGTGNRVVLYSSVRTHVIVDVAGYFTTGGVEAITPARVLDTRPGRSTVDGVGAGTGAIAAGSPRQVAVRGRAGVPVGATAVALNVTATGPTGEGYLTVYPTGASRPAASNLNFVSGQTVANSVIAKVGTDGSVSIYNSNKSVHVLVDVAGYFTSASDYVSLVPARFADTRPNGNAVSGPGYAPARNSARVGAIGTATTNGDQVDILVSGRGSVPLTDTGAVVLNVTVAQPSASGHVTVFPLDTFMPGASSVNFTAGSTTPNLVVAKLGRGGGISIVSSVPSSQLIVDVLGYFPGPSTADVAGAYSSIQRDSLGMPLQYDRCWTIPYQINTANAQPGWVTDVQTSVALLEAATGIDFLYAGTTTQTPTTDANALDYLLIAFTTEAVIPELAGGVVGLGGSAYGGFGNDVLWMPEQFFVGFAYFDSGTVMPAGFGTGLAFGQVALHELAHVVGLGHVANTDELMNASTIDRAGYFGTGDLDGLALLYKTQDCPGSPATYGNALRSGAGKHAPAGTDLHVVTTADIHGRH